MAVSRAMRTIVDKMEKTHATKWRSSRSLRGVRSQLVAAINYCDDGACVQIELKTARNLIEVCNQAIHTEEGHEA